jgi:WD40-like Beta Propeller Repeat
VGKTQWLVGSRRSASYLGAALSLLFVLVVVPAARADEIAYACGYDICTIDPDHPETHADLTETPMNTEFEPAWSPDGSRIAFNGSYEGHAGIWTISTAEPTAGATEVIDDPEIGGGEPAWSPDGTRIAFAGANEHTYTNINVYVSPADGTSPPQVIGETALEEKGPTWAPDGSRLAFSRYTSIVTGAPEESAVVTTLPNGLGVEPAWSPDGTRIAAITSGEPHHVRLIDANGDDTATELPIPAEMGGAVAWSPDSSHVVYVDEADQVRIAPTNPPGEGFEIKLPTGVIVPHEPSFSPEGNRIVFWAEDTNGGLTNRIYIAPATGGEATQVTDGSVSALDPTWKPGPAGGGENPGGGSSGGGSAGGSSSGGSPTGTGNPPATRAPVVLKLAAFRHPAVSNEFLSGGYVPCSLGSTNAVCHASGEATFDAPITHSLDYARSKAKSLDFARGSVTVPNGQTKPLPLKLTAAGKKLLKRGEPLKLTETIVETAPGAKAKTTTKTFTVTPPKKHRVR